MATISPTIPNGFLHIRTQLLGATVGLFDRGVAPVAAIHLKYEDMGPAVEPDLVPGAMPGRMINVTGKIDVGGFSTPRGGTSISRKRSTALWKKWREERFGRE